MAGAALHILDILLATMDLSIAHDLEAGVAIDAVQCIFTTRELGDGLVIIVQAIDGLVGARVELDIAKAVIAPVMAGITLRVGN